MGEEAMNNSDYRPDGFRNASFKSRERACKIGLFRLSEATVDREEAGSISSSQADFRKPPIRSHTASQCYMVVVPHSKKHFFTCKLYFFVFVQIEVYLKTCFSHIIVTVFHLDCALYTNCSLLSPRVFPFE